MGDGRWRTLFVTIIIRWLTNLRCPNTWDLIKASLLMKRSFCTSCITASWLQVCFYIPYRIKFPSRKSSVQLYGTPVQLKCLKCATSVQLPMLFLYHFGACSTTRLPSLCNYTMSYVQSASVFKGATRCDVAWSYVGISPKRKGWCSTAAVGISLTYETKVIEPVGEPSNTT